MSTDIVKLDLFDGESFKRWQKKPWLNLVNFSSSEITISFGVATSPMLCQIHSWTYIKIILVLGNFEKLSRNASSRKTQQDVVNRVFKYLKKTIDYGLEYSEDPLVLEGYNDSSWITDQEDYASTSGWIFTLGGGYGNNLDKVHLSEYGSEAVSYELKGLALKHSEKPRYRPKASFNGSTQSGLNERGEGYA
ncbi:hypothetical protein Tco_1236920 [Tanacetum coccineum]